MYFKNSSPVLEKKSIFNWHKIKFGRRSYMNEISSRKLVFSKFISTRHFETIQCFLWWIMLAMKVATLQKRNALPTRVMIFFFCNDSYLHISSGSSKKSIHCLYVHLTFFQINKWIVNSRKYSLNWCICTSNVKKNEIAKSYYMGIWVWHHFDYFK